MMNVTNKALLLVSIVILTLSGFYLFEGIIQYNKEIDRSIHEEKNVIDHLTRDIKKYSYAPYLYKIENFIKTNVQIREAFADRDRQRLYELSLPLYKNLRIENKYFHAMDFNLPDGTIFLRVQKPKLFGDNITQSRTIVADVHKNKKQRFGFDVGQHSADFRVAQPIFEQGKYIGAIEFGVTIKQLEDALKNRLRTKVTTILRANNEQKSLFIKNGFRDFGDYILMAHGDTIYDQIPKNFNFSGDDKQIIINGKTNIFHSSEILRNYRGKIIGRLLILQDISGEINKKKSFITHALLLTAFLWTLSFIVLYFIFGGLIGRLEKYAIDLKEAQEALQHSHDQLEKRVEHRTSELGETNIVLKNEIKERLSAEAQLNEQKNFLHTIIESIASPFFVIDAESYTILLANKAAYRLTGTHPPQGLTCYSLTHGRTKPCSGTEHPCPLQEVKIKKTPIIAEHIHLDENGNERIFEINAYPIFDKDGKVIQIIEYNIDISDQKKTEEEKQNIWTQLVQSQKMEAMGLLAGGVSHDFNNLLTAIIGNVQLAIMTLPRGEDKLRHYLDQIIYASDRASGLVRQLLIFSSKQATEDFVEIRINNTISTLEKMLSRLIGEKIVIKTNLSPDVWNIRGDEDNIGQVITNLVINARDAMPEGGEISISTQNIAIDDNYKRQVYKARTGHFVLITISDTGQGIEKKDIDHIFEPFFTTKEKGKGTGLGLSVVYGIIDKHRGWINVYSEPGFGAVFRIYLPAFDDRQAAIDTENKTERLYPQIVGNGETILLIEDEEFVMEVAKETLQGMGFNIVTATDVGTARSLFAEEKDNIKIIFSDVGLPDGNGAVLADELLSQVPTLKILLASGYPEQISAFGTTLGKKCTFIKKPYGIIDLKKAISEILTRA